MFLIVSTTISLSSLFIASIIIIIVRFFLFSFELVLSSLSLYIFSTTNN